MRLNHTSWNQRGSSEHGEVPTRKAEQVIRRLKELNGGSVIPVPVEEIAFLCGYRIYWLSTLPDELSGVVDREKRLIAVNARHAPTRRRFSVAHELGHILLRHPPESGCSAPEIRKWNREADRFAAELLIPSEDVLEQCCTSDFYQLLRRYRVSAGALKKKLATLGISPTSNPAFGSYHRRRQ